MCFTPKKIGNFKPDLIIYTHDPALLGCLIAKENNIPSILVIYEHGFHYNWRKSECNPLLNIALNLPVPFYKMICKKVLKNTNLIIANSNRTADFCHAGGRADGLHRFG